LITFLIPFDLGDCGFVALGARTPSSACVLGARTPSSAFVPDSERAQLGSRDNNATPPTATEDEIKKRLFMIRVEDDIDSSQIT
jgi:hypothetical protein